MEAPGAGHYRESATSGKPVATSGNTPITPKAQDLPPSEEADPDIVLQEEIKKPVKGWRLEQNSNGYWRWRYLAKGDNGMSQTYRDKAGKIAYKRGSQYVRLGELDAAREEEKRLRADEPI